MNNDLGSGSLKKLILMLAIPSMFAQFINVLYSIVDRIFISNIPEIGQFALAGVGVAGPITTLFTSFTFLIGQGGAPLVAMKLGQKDKESAKKILANSFLFLVICSIVLMTIFLTFKRPILYLFGATDNTYKYASSYMTVYAAGSFFSIVGLGLNSFITCQGYSKTAMTSVLIGAIANIILDPILIYSANLGVSGAAYATVISQLLSFLFVFSFLLSKRSGVKLVFRGYSLKTFKQIISIGFSPFLISATDSIILIALNAVLKATASDPDLFISANTIVLSFMTLISLPLSGITLGVQPILSFNYGSKNNMRVKKGFYGMLCLCGIYCLSMFIFAMFFNGLFINIFSPEQAVYDLASKAIRLYLIGLLLLPFQWACVDSLVGLGKANIAVVLSLFRKGLIFVLTMIIPLFAPTVYTFLGEGIGDIVASTLSATVFFMVFDKILKKNSDEYYIEHIK